MWKHHSESVTPGQFVPAGDLTGTYYILFTNLDKDATWQNLKDWLRAGDIKTEHIEITKKTGTSRQGNDTDMSVGGWARFQGRENYQKATTRIHSHDYKKRRMRIYAHNADKPIPCSLLNVPSVQTQEESGPYADASFHGQTAPTAPRYPAQHGPQTLGSFAPLGMPYDNTLQAPTQSAWSNVAVSPYYNNPTETGPDYQVLAEQNLAYYVADPTTYHNTDPGYDCTVQYGSATQALVHGMGNTSLNNDPNAARNVTGANFTIAVKREPPSPLGNTDVVEYIKAYAPAGVQHIQRIDLGKNGRHEHTAVVVFDSYEVCQATRQGLFGKALNGLQLDEGGGSVFEQKKPSVPRPQQQRPSKPEGSYQTTREGKARDNRSTQKERYKGQKRSRGSRSTIPSSSESSKPVEQQRARPSASSSSKGKGREEHQPALTSPVVVSSDYSHRASKSEEKRPAMTGPVIVDSGSLHRAAQSEVKSTASKSGEKRPAMTGPVIVSSDHLHRASKSEVKGSDSRSERKTPAKTGPVIVNGTSPYCASDPTSRSEEKISANTVPVIVDGTSYRASKSEGKKRER